MIFAYPANSSPTSLVAINEWLPDLPERHTDDGNHDDATNMAAERFELVIESHIGNGCALRDHARCIGCEECSRAAPSVDVDPGGSAEKNGRARTLTSGPGRCAKVTVPFAR